MSTYQKSKQPARPKLLWTSLRRSTKTTSRHLKAALIGLLLICVAATSGCMSTSKPNPEVPKVSVDASLMVEPNLTTQLLGTLSK